MIKYPKNPRPFEVGEKVYNLFTDTVDIICRTDGSPAYTIMTENCDYTNEGKRMYHDTLRALYHLDELPLTITAELPRPKIKKDTKVRVWNHDRHKWNRYATGDFDDEGRILCFRGGADNFSSDDNDSSPWQHYEIVEDE